MRGWDDYDEGYGIYLGQGQMHDLRDADREPRLWRAKSVSRAAAVALDRPPAALVARVGFYVPRGRR